MVESDFDLVGNSGLFFTQYWKTRNHPSPPTSLQPVFMDPDAARTARESLDLAFHMSNILDTGLDRHTLSVLIALCDLGLNPEALAAVVKELRREPTPQAPLSSASSPLP